MKLSIVTINYNNAEGLRMTMESVLKQTYRDIEYIVVDGASTDGSVDVIREMSAALNDGMSRDKSLNDGITLVWSSEPDKGIYNAMNKGIEIALGRRIVNSFNRSELVEDKNKVCADYIQILNSGDILASNDVTERMMSALHSFTPSTFNEKIGISILYGNMIRDYGNGKLSRDVAKAEGIAREVEWTMDDFINGTVNHDPTYIHRDIYEKYGLYDENLKIVSDWKWFVNAVVFKGEKLYYVPIDVTIFDTTGISETNLAAREKERRAELEKLLPAAILKDYDNYHFPISQIQRLKKHHVWGLVYFMERVLFKIEKWGVLRK